MNKKILIVGAASVIMLAGCQNLTEQLTTKIAEGVINSSTGGEVKVNMSGLKDGKITVTTKEGTINMSGNEQGGSMTMVDEYGKTVMQASGDDKSVTIKDEKGNVTNYKGEEGTARPASVPADMPSLPGSKEFAFFTVNELGSLSFSTDSKDVKATCDQEVALLTAAGWQPAANGFTSETENNVLKSYTKGEVDLMLTCATNDDMTVNVNLLETKHSS